LGTWEPCAELGWAERTKAIRTGQESLGVGDGGCMQRREYRGWVRIGRTGSRVGWWVWEDELWVMGDAVA
jgi:hypothetical protein